MLSESGDICGEFEIDSPKVVLGRTSKSNIVLEDELVSRLHAQIIRTEDGFFVTDMGSTNGTYLNGKNINPKQLFHISSNDTLTVGKYRFIFQLVRESIPEASYVGAGARGTSVKERNEGIGRTYFRGRSSGLEPEYNRYSYVNTSTNPRFRVSYRDERNSDAFDDEFGERDFQFVKDVYQEKKRFKDKLLRSLRERLSNYPSYSRDLTDEMQQESKGKESVILALPSALPMQQQEDLNKNIINAQEEISSVDDMHSVHNNEAKRNIQNIGENVDLLSEQAFETANKSYFDGLSFAEKEAKVTSTQGFATEIKTKIFKIISSNPLIPSSIGISSLAALIYCYIRYSPAFG